MELRRSSLFGSRYCWVDIHCLGEWNSEVLLLCHQLGHKFWLRKNVDYLHTVFELEIKVDLTEIVVVLLKLFGIRVKLRF